jgi:hypothetical protein
MQQFLKSVLRLELEITIALAQFIVFCARPLFPQVTKITYYWLNSLGKQQKKIAFFVLRKTFNAEAKNLKKIISVWIQHFELVDANCSSSFVVDFMK